MTGGGQVDPHAEMGASRDASSEVIRRAYRQIARRHHPDVNRDAGGPERFAAAARVARNRESRSSATRYRTSATPRVGSRGRTERTIAIASRASTLRPYRTKDPDGREVVLDARTRRHLTIRRPQLIHHIDTIIDVVHLPDYREDDEEPGRERFYRQDLDPRRWLRVVVDFTETPALVVTAFIQWIDPRPPR
jgi:hypothetical protein